MNFEMEPMQMDDEGNLIPLQDICLIAAERTFRERFNTDTNPTIVQMIHRRKLIPHWYFRSDEYISQPFFIPAKFLQPYVGPANSANPGLYGPGTYEVDQEFTNQLIAHIRRDQE